MAAMLKLDNLNAWYGHSHVLQGVTLDVNAGEIVTLIGRNGAGKTTTLRTVMGLVAKKAAASYSTARTWRASPRSAAIIAASPTCPKSGASCRDCRCSKTCSSGCLRRRTARAKAKSSSASPKRSRA